MAVARKVIITCAPTGAIHTPSMSRYLPVTPDEIADAAIAAAEAGAAILHLHARDPKDGRPTQEPDMFREFLPRIHNSTNAVINITTGGAPQMTIAERMRPAATFKPEVASLNMGTINFGLFPMLDRYEDDIKHDWERVHLSNKAIIFRNTFEDIEALMQMGAANGTRFEFECYDIGHLYNLKYFVDKGLVKPPFFIQSVFGIFGGIGGHPEDLMHMRRTADRLFGNDYHWSILGAGSHQMKLATTGAAMGSHVRVGLEDSLWIGPGKLAESNAQQVKKIRAILEEMSLEIATPDEAREILQLKGRDKVDIGANTKKAA
ncbi:MAG TPA: 3-keto-5-aminohexanoate cleavage protein [Alphaproteobacteria bacterium]